MIYSYLISCSDGRKTDEKEQIIQLKKRLIAIGCKAFESKCIFAVDGSIGAGDAIKRASELNRCFADKRISHIFDISGGDISNEILPYLDYNTIASSRAVFWGYSDLTCIINAIYAKTGKMSLLYQIRNILHESRKMQEKVGGYLRGDGEELFRINGHYINGKEMSGVVVGGNIRCFLKLAGTEYFPDTKGKILLIESLSGGCARMTAYLSQLRQLGVFNKINGIILGTFSQMEKDNLSPTMENLVLTATEGKLPIYKTQEIGHSPSSKAIVIGKEWNL